MPGAPDLLREGASIGHFRLERMIGRGGMGVVWSAIDARDRKRVALKFLDDVRRDDPVSHARFLREAEMARKLSHPNIVHVHDIDYTLEGVPFLVMDLLEGESLRARMKLAQRLSPKECGVVLAPVAGAMAAAHESGIVHRDLKPENVFLSSDGVRVLDFGIAKRLSADEVQDTFTSTGAMLGTPAYMAPEQIFGERDIDGKADVWALGVILYECLSGARPVEGGVGQILKAVTSGTIKPLADHPFVMKMLAAEAAQRPSMREVERELERWRDDAPPEVAAATTGTGKPQKVAAWAIGAVVLAVGVGGAIRFATKHEPEPVVTPTPSVGATETASSPSVTTSVAIVTPPASTSATVKATAVRHASPPPPPPPATSGNFTKPAEFDVVLGRVVGMGNQSTQSDVVTALQAMKPCFPAPTTDERWTVALTVTWPKRGARSVSFAAARNSKPFPNAQIEACAKKTFDAATIATPDGQDDSGGTSYIRMSAGYY